MKALSRPHAPSAPRPRPRRPREVPASRGDGTPTPPTDDERRGRAQRSRHQPLRQDLELDLVGAAADAQDADVTVVPRDRGLLQVAGTAEELAADEIVRKVYLGTNFELKRKL